jgi:hypothetical protein
MSGPRNGIEIRSWASDADREAGSSEVWHRNPAKPLRGNREAWGG